MEELEKEEDMIFVDCTDLEMARIDHQIEMEQLDYDIDVLQGLYYRFEGIRNKKGIYEIGDTPTYLDPEDLIEKIFNEMKVTTDINAILSLQKLHLQVKELTL
jgi:hypothetical protein